MISKIAILSLIWSFAVSGFAAELPARSVAIRDWNICIPPGVEVEKTDGPDFSVTYFRFPKLDAQFGIYEGGFPQSFAPEGKDVAQRRDKIAGQEVAWSIWKEKANGLVIYRAEVFLVCAVTELPNSNQTHEEKFHVFLDAQDEKVLQFLQGVVRTLKRNVPKSSPGSTHVPGAPPA